MKNEKGFTLVELLAVIVILALIMSIAVISITGVLDDAKTKTFKETGASIIDGVKKQLLIANELEPGDYYFTKALLTKGGGESPFGGNLTIPDSLVTTTGGNCAGGKMIGTVVCRTPATPTHDCSATTAISYVRIANDANRTASICLTAGESGKKYIDVNPTANVDNSAGTEANLLNSNYTAMIK